MYNAIRELCAERGTNVCTLEAELGLGRGTIGKWNKHDPQLSKIKLVADYFNLPIEYFIEAQKKAG